MSTKYHVAVEQAAPKFHSLSKFSTLESEGCLGCLKCVKRESCVYDVYAKRKFDPLQLIIAGDDVCVSCMRCVQECKKNILGRMGNPQFEAMGDEYWKPDIIASIWKQAESGKIPVSGAGYRGPFAGPGFDEMWTDMSEIVRPTRDGIHGREYISTLIELGHRARMLEFDATGQLVSPVAPLVEIPIPVVFEMPDLKFAGDAVKRAVVNAARHLKTFVVASVADAAGVLRDRRDRLIVRYNPRHDGSAKLDGVAGIEIDEAGADEIRVLREIKSAHPAAMVGVRIRLDEHAADRAARCAAAGADFIHLEADSRGNGFGKNG